MTNRVLTGLFGLSLLVLQACGGGGGGGSAGVVYSGSTSQATLDSDNADDLARAGASGSNQSVSSASTPAVFRSQIDRNALLQGLAAQMLQLLNHGGDDLAARGAANRTIDYSASLCPWGGSAIATIPDSASSTNYSFTFLFANCSDSSSGMTYTYGGTVQASYLQSGGAYSFSIAFVNFTVSVTGSHTMTGTLNLTMSCSGSDTSGYSDAVCTYHSDFTGFDGRVYRIKNVTITGNDTSGYTISATVYHPDYGYVTVTTTTPITFQCSGGYPDSGTMVLTGAGGDTATVDFISCSQYVVTYNLASTTYDW